MFGNLPGEWSADAGKNASEFAQPQPFLLAMPGGNCDYDKTSWLAFGSFPECLRYGSDALGSLAGFGRWGFSLCGGLAALAGEGSE
jgi:hypothetical protein